MNKSIEILCAITCIYEVKKLAIICPLGKITGTVDTFNPEYLAKRFSGDVNTAYTVDSLVEIEQMIAPIVNRFGKIPDKSYATVAGIRDMETGDDMPFLKAELDKLYPIEKELIDLGYNTYGVFYVEHNIEEFADKNDIPFSEDRTLINIPCKNFNLEGLICEVRKTYIDEISVSCIPSLFNECFRDIEYYNKIGIDNICNMQDINKFFNKVPDGSIYIPFARRDIYGKLNLANGEKISLNSINTGEMEFEANNEYGISIDLIVDNYVFNPVEHVFHENSNNYSISILEEGEDLTNKVMTLIEKYIV